MLLAAFELHGQRVLCSDTVPVHPFDFTLSMSLFVECATAAELDRFAEALSEGGECLMPPGDHGVSRRFARVQDRYGVPWKRNVAREPWHRPGRSRVRGARTRARYGAVS